MEIIFKDAEVLILDNHCGDICLRCTRTINDGQRVEARTQTPTFISMDHVQALELVMQILQRLDVNDSRGPT